MSRDHVDLSEALFNAGTASAIRLTPGACAVMLESKRGYKLLARFPKLESLQFISPGGEGFGAAFTSKNLRSLADYAPQLRALEFWSSGTDDFSALAALPHLESLLVTINQELKSTASLAKLSRLTRLELSSCDALKELAPLAQLPAVKWLRLERTAITDVAPLASLATLEEVELDSCSELIDLTPLLAHPGLKRLGGDEAVARVWESRAELARIPPWSELLEGLASGGLERVCESLAQLAKLVRLLDLGDRPTPLLARFGLSPGHARVRASSRAVALPALDKLLKPWWKKLPPASLADVLDATWTSPRLDLQAAWRALEELAARGDAESQRRAVQAFLRVSEHRETGHRAHEKTLLDRLLDEWLPAFSASAQAELLTTFPANALRADRLAPLFPLALRGPIDAAERARLLRALSGYCRERTAGHSAGRWGAEAADEIDELLAEATKRVAGEERAELEALAAEVAQTRRALEAAERESEAKPSAPPAAIDPAAEEQARLLKKIRREIERAFSDGTVGELVKAVGMVGQLSNPAQLREVVEECVVKSLARSLRGAPWDDARKLAACYRAAFRLVGQSDYRAQTLVALIAGLGVLDPKHDLAPLLEEVLPKVVRVPQLAFNLACWHAKGRRHAELLHWAEQAMLLGRLPEDLRAEHDFDEYQADPAFVALLARYEFPAPR